MMGWWLLYRMISGVDGTQSFRFGLYYLSLGEQTMPGLDELFDF